MDAQEWVRVPGVFASESISRDGWSGGGGFDLVSWIVVDSIAAFIHAIARGIDQARVRRRPLWVSADRRRLRLGRQVLYASAIESARYIQLTMQSSTRSPERVLRLAAVSDVQFDVFLRNTAGRAVGRETQKLLLEFLPGTSIAIPLDRWDPKGKFARSGNPTHLTKEETIAIVERPPHPDEILEHLGRD